MNGQHDSERGSALIFVMMMLFVVGLISTAYLKWSSTEIKQVRLYKDYKQAMGVAEAGMDKAVIQLKNAVFKYGSPTENDLKKASPPTIADFRFVTPAGLNAYSIIPDGQFHRNEKIEQGRWRGMYGDFQQYKIRVGVTKDSTGRGVVLTQTMQSLAIPVFQFGVFYDKDLEIFPGPEMTFSGPVHTNAKLFLGSGRSLYFDDLVTVHEELYRHRKDDPDKFPGGDVRIKNGLGKYVSMTDDQGPIDHNREEWAVEALRKWDGRVQDSSHKVPEMKLPIPTGDNPHDILEPADTDNDDPQLLANKFETKADIIIWRDSAGEAHGVTSTGEDFPLVYGEPTAVGGAININPNNSVDNEFLLVKADGTTIGRDDLTRKTADWEGEATLIHVKPKGNGNQNGFIIDGEAVDLKNSETYDISSVEGAIPVRVFNDKRNRHGKAIGHWWVAPTATKTTVKVENVLQGETKSVVKESEFGDWREGNGSPQTMVSMDIDVDALTTHPDYPTEGALVYAYNEAASAGQTDVVRLVNGAKLPFGGLSIASPDPVYIQGDYNVDGFKRPSLIAGDAVNILSNSWTDENSWDTLSHRKASQTTINTILMTGNDNTKVSDYNGGLENVLRFLEDWNKVRLVFKGSIACVWNSEVANGPWVYGNNRYHAPIRDWGYDEMYRNPRNSPPKIPNVIALEALDWGQDTWTKEEVSRK